VGCEVRFVWGSEAKTQTSYIPFEKISVDLAGFFKTFHIAARGQNSHGSGLFLS